MTKQEQKTELNSIAEQITKVYEIRETKTDTAYALLPEIKGRILGMYTKDLSGKSTKRLARIACRFIQLVNI